jgi:hypothetical protein
MSTRLIHLKRIDSLMADDDEPAVTEIYLNPAQVCFVQPHATWFDRSDIVLSGKDSWIVVLGRAADIAHQITAALP